MSHVLPHDPALPQLATALNEQAMAEVFATELCSQGQLQVQGCAVDRIKYRPRRSCSVSYLLALRDQRSGRAFKQRVAARYCVTGDSARRHAKLASRASRPSPAGPTLSHVASLNLLAHWLPNDARLDAVAELDDDMHMRDRWLPEVVAALTHGQGRLLAYETSLVQYVPEHRVCARVDMHLQEAPGLPMVARSVYAKADAERSGPVTHNVMQALSGGAAQLAGKLRTPRAILWQADSGLHWHAAAPGRPLLDISPYVSPTLASRVGAQLAALHSTPVPIAHADMLTELEQRPSQVADLLGLVEAEWQPMLRRLVRTLEEGVGRLTGLPSVTLHGDLHPRNILVDGQRLTLIDLDGVRPGPAAYELGAWIADALYRAVLTGLTLESVAPAWRAFLGAYADATALCTVTQPLLAWCTAYHLLCTRAYRCVANQKPGRYAAVPKLISLATAIARAETPDAARRCAFSTGGHLMRDAA